METQRYWPALEATQLTAEPMVGLGQAAQPLPLSHGEVHELAFNPGNWEPAQALIPGLKRLSSFQRGGEKVKDEKHGRRERG